MNVIVVHLMQARMAILPSQACVRWVVSASDDLESNVAHLPSMGSTEGSRPGHWVAGFAGSGGLDL